MELKDIKIHAKEIESDLLDSIADEVLPLCEEIHLMPDTHIGLSVPIGFVGKLKTDRIIPNMVGVDIGCGMTALKIDKEVHQFDFNKLHKAIADNIPTSFNIRDRSIKSVKTRDLLNKLNMPFNNKEEHRFVNSIGTLGGGNHFIELNESEDHYYLVIHSGSRNLGSRICKYHQNKTTRDKPYLEGQQFHEYVSDMNLAMEYAQMNRFSMLEVILRNYDEDLLALITEDNVIDVPHNYYDEDLNIVYKGAISSKKGEQIIIPINMRDGTIFATGLGNEDWLSAAPHGAGRVLSRTAARKQLDIDDMQHQMKDVYSKTISTHVLDEHPDAYRDMQEILDVLDETATDVVIAKPIYNFKG